MSASTNRDAARYPPIAFYSAIASGHVDLLRHIVRCENATVTGATAGSLVGGRLSDARCRATLDPGWGFPLLFGAAYGSVPVTRALLYGLGHGAEFDSFGRASVTQRTRKSATAKLDASALHAAALRVYRVFEAAALQDLLEQTEQEHRQMEADVEDDGDGAAGREERQKLLPPSLQHNQHTNPRAVGAKAQRRLQRKAAKRARKAARSSHPVLAVISQSIACCGVTIDTVTSDSVHGRANVGGHGVGDGDAGCGVDGGSCGDGSSYGLNIHSMYRAAASEALDVYAALLQAGGDSSAPMLIHVCKRDGIAASAGAEALENASAGKLGACAHLGGAPAATVAKGAVDTEVTELSLKPIETHVFRAIMLGAGVGSGRSSNGKMCSFADAPTAVVAARTQGWSSAHATLLELERRCSAARADTAGTTDTSTDGFVNVEEALQITGAQTVAITAQESSSAAAGHSSQEHNRVQHESCNTAETAERVGSPFPAFDNVASVAAPAREKVAGVEGAFVLRGVLTLSEVAALRSAVEMKTRPSIHRSSRTASGRQARRQCRSVSLRTACAKATRPTRRCLLAPNDFAAAASAALTWCLHGADTEDYATALHARLCDPLLLVSPSDDYGGVACEPVEPEKWDVGEGALRALAERVRPLLPPHPFVARTTSGMSPSRCTLAQGSAALASCLRCYRYDVGQGSLPHFDSAFRVHAAEAGSGGERRLDGTRGNNRGRVLSFSAFSFLIYLSDDFNGGATTFFRPIQMPACSTPLHSAETQVDTGATARNVSQSQVSRRGLTWSAGAGRLALYEIAARVRCNAGDCLVFPHGNGDGLPTQRRKKAGSIDGANLADIYPNPLHEGSVVRGRAGNAKTEPKFLIRSDVMYDICYPQNSVTKKM